MPTTETIKEMECQRRIAENERRTENERLRDALRRLEKANMFPETDEQRAVRDVARAALRGCTVDELRNAKEYVQMNLMNDVGGRRAEIAWLMEQNERLVGALGKVDAYLTTVAVPRPDWLIEVVRNAMRP